MRTPSKFCPGGPATHHRSGVALILVLATLFVIVIIVVGFTLAMQIERQASQSSAANTQVDFIAQAAVSQATAVLANNIPPVASGIGTDTSAQIATSGSATNWWVNPGLLSTQSGTSAPKLIKLYTSNNTTAANVDTTAPAGSTSVDLNRPLLTNPNVHTITGTASAQPMNFAWVNVLQDPGGVHQPDPTKPKYNPVVGRYAFWMEPETSRIDITTARGKSGSLDLAQKAPPPKAPIAPYYDYSRDTLDFSPGIAGANVVQYARNGISENVGNVGMVELSVLNGINNIDANALYITQQAMARGETPPLTAGGNAVIPPASLDEVDQIKNFFLNKTNGQNFYDANRFYMTNYSRDPEFSVFGGSRLAANDNQNPNSPNTGLFYPYIPFAYQYYLNVNEPIWFDTNNSVAHGRTLAAIHYLSTLMQSATWPGYSGTFASKWGAGNPGLREADQVAWNIYGLGNYILTPYRSLGSTSFPGSNNTFVYSADQTYDKYDLYGFAPGNPNNNLGNTFTLVYAVGGTMWDGNGTVPHSRYLPRASQLLIDEAVFSFGSEPYVIGGVPKLDINGNQLYVIDIQDFADYVFPAGMEAESKTDLMNLYYNPGTPSLKLDYETTTTVGYLQYQMSVNAVASPPTTANLLCNEATFSGSGGSSANYLTITPTIAKVTDPVTGAVTYPAVNSTMQLTPDQTLLLPGIIYQDTNNGQGYPLGATIMVSNVRFKMATCQSPSLTTELYPLRARSALGGFGSGTGYCEPSAAADTDAVLTMSSSVTFTVDGTKPSPSTNTLALKLGDPRLGGNSAAWSQDPGFTPGRLASANYLNSSLNGGFSDTSKLALSFKGDYYPWLNSNDYPDVSPGQYFYAPTGVQRNLPFETLSLLPAASSPYAEGRTKNPPDYLLLDLLCSPYRTTSMSSARGKININSIIYPPYIGNNVQRLAPLQALFANLTVNGSPVSASIAQDIQTEERSLGGFRYSGELAEVSDMQLGSNQWQQEALLRSLAGLITTRSNSFGLWGAAQAVKETANGTIIPIADKHFHAIIERYVWPGVDGVRGNGYYDPTQPANSNYTRAGIYQYTVPPFFPYYPSPGQTVNDVLDGPTTDEIPIPPNANLTGFTTLNNFLSPPGIFFPGVPVPGGLVGIDIGKSNAQRNRMSFDTTASRSILEASYNPLAPYMRYKVVEFKYLNE